MNKSELKNRLRGKIGLKDVCTLDSDEERQLVWDLIEKDDKYAWHDLRKDPTDLPEDFYDYFPCMIARKIGDEVITEYCEYSFIDNFGYFFIGVPQDEIIAWKEIEPFVEVEV